MTEQSVIRAERRAKAINLLGDVCSKCGTIENLTFDHIKNDRQDTKHQISQMLGSNWDKLLIELRKCQLLCVTCHGKKTAIDHHQSLLGTHGTTHTYRALKCRCEPCRKAKADYRASWERKGQ